jgi:hypothetical protein
VEPVFSLGINEVQKVLSGKADEIQREFVKVSRELEETGRLLLELRGKERDELLVEQKKLRKRQQELAQEVNLWREHAKSVRQQRSLESLKKYLTDLLPKLEPHMRSILERTIYLIDAPEEEVAQYVQSQSTKIATTPAGRLIERARLSYDLRGSDPAERQRAAVEFANRPGMALDKNAIDEIEEAIEDPDPLVKEVAILTTIQLHRYRAMRSADPKLVYESVKRLTNINHPAVIPSLIEFVDKPQTTFTAAGGGSVEDEVSARSRMIALLRLVELHTSEAQAAVQKRRFDQNKQIAQAAQRALELFPGPWSGPLKGKKPA